MYKFVPFIKYEVNGTVYENSRAESEHYSFELVVSDDRIKCVLHPKTQLNMIEFNVSAIRKIGYNELFYAGGYQSWTTSREFGKNDVFNGYMPLANISGFTKNIVGISGDYTFTDYGKKGCFHSHVYTYFRQGEDLEFYGSTSERQGFTIFETDMNENNFKISKDVEGLEVSDEYLLLDIICLKGKYDEVFDKYFGMLNLRKSKIDKLSGYTSWYNYFQKIDEKIILRDLNGLDRVKENVSIFQIDDGYESYVGDWLEVDKKKFPNGMQPIAKAIHDKGYLAGIWLAPFSAQRVSKTAKEHPDWLIKDNKTGKTLWGCPGWGGAYTLDIYVPEVREYIKKFFDVVLRDWGFDMVKLDFLYSECMQPRNGKTRGQIMCEAMDLLRECVGEDKLFLGCGVPIGPAMGVVDACRISCDVDLSYKDRYKKFGVNNEVPSAQYAINNSIFRRHLNGRVWCNDPDVFFLRDKNLKFNDEQKLLLAKVNNMCGNVLFVSDDAGEFDDKTTELLRKFFTKTDAEILYAEYASDEDIFVRFKENGKISTLRFNLKTGKSNVKELV